MKKKWWIMRAYAFLLASLLALALLPAAGRAVLSDVYFTAVNEQLLDLSSETMPFWSDGVLYVSSRVFEGTDLGVSYVRNNTMGLVMLYTNRVDLRFDLEDQTAYDKRGNVYNGHAIERSGGIFFPLDLVCRYFRLTWSYSQTNTAPLIRIKSSSGILDDAGFIDAASTQMASRYAAYEKSLGGAPESGGGLPSQLPEPRRLLWCRRRRDSRCICCSAWMTGRMRWRQRSSWGAYRVRSCWGWRSWRTATWCGR